MRAIFLAVEDPFSPERVRAAYDAVAEDYQATFGDDLVDLPLDRRMLEVCREAAADRLILDVGCGTGAAASYLVSLGARVVGVDLSLGMLNASSSTHPYLKCQGDIHRLPFHDGAFAAATAFYMIHCFSRHHIATVLNEIRRVLQPRGVFLLATHLGEGEVYVDDFLGHRIATTGGTLYHAHEITEAVCAAGFVVERDDQRSPLEHEYQSRRIYLLTRRAD
jgi:ubiquinone/menaquinone biosynthesis C-methylase UbiE